jgi:hypothetical protein
MSCGDEPREFAPMEKSHKNEFSWRGVTRNYPHGAEGVTRNCSDEEESHEIILMVRIIRNYSDGAESHEMILIKRSHKK